MKLLALALWGVAAAMVFFSFDALNRPEMVARRVLTPGLFWFVTFVAIFLPVVTLVLMGVASWRRSKPFAYAGLGTIGLMVLCILGVRVVGLIRQWITGQP